MTVVAMAATMIGVAAAPATADADRIVDIPGRNLENCIHGKLGIPSATPLTEGDLATLTTLACGIVGDRTLEGLQHAVNLESLTLTGWLNPTTFDSDAAATFLEPLRSVTSLHTAVLSFGGGVAFSLAPLSQLPNLASLAVQELPNDGLAGLLPGPALTDLRVTHVWPSIAGIDQLTGLTSLSLRNVPAATAEARVPLAPLQTLTELTTVSIQGGGDAGDLEMFSVMKDLTSLSLDGASASSLDGLDVLPLLTTLQVSDAGLQGLAGIERLSGLTSIDVHGNDLSDISPLASLTELATVNVNSNQLADISALGSLELTDYSAWDQSITVDDPVIACTPVSGFAPTGVTGASAPLTPTTGYPEYVQVGVVDGSTMAWTVPGTHTVSFYHPESQGRFSGTFTVTVADSGAPCAWHGIATITAPTRVNVGAKATATVTWAHGLHPDYTIEWVDGAGKVLATGPSASTGQWAGKNVRVRVAPDTAGFDPTPLTSGAAHAARTLPTAMGISLLGTGAVSQTLRVEETARPAEVSLIYRWYRDGVRIPGQTKHYYTLTTADAGHTISVRGHASDTYGYWWPGDFTTNAVKVNATLPFTYAAPPALPSTVVVGSTLRADGLGGATWSPKPTTLNYQWFRDGTAIAGANRVTYQVASADAGHQIKVRVTGARSGYLPASVWSGVSKAGKRLAPVTPTLTGTAKVGNTLTVKRGTWGPGTVSTKVQWYVNGKAVSGATGSTFRVRPTDAYRSISVKVTGSKPGYFTTSRTSSSKKPTGIDYASCTDLRKHYPDGIAKSSSVRDKVGTKLGGPITKATFVSASLYALNDESDRDKDGWACER
ncbi:excalibur calcium-binding domain-containing protein [Demequina sp. NBRC 110057]|uniref:excalibur calcium-binding domain-containing protein n=1 Tax=Demequina sp. NBRC 110057 TaxID=1570346 RepID=UPI001356648E|nr:excalibur calcium-binding domain-containing protein [Demequina sp. NBRC 110057]